MFKHHWHLLVLYQQNNNITTTNNNNNNNDCSGFLEPTTGMMKNEEEKQIKAGLVSVITANSSSCGDSGIEVSMFDSSVENHFRAMDTIYKLCGEGNTGGFDNDEIERLSSTITFLSEWRYFNYRPKILRFMPETGFSNGKEAQNDITLCQDSATSVPKYDMEERPEVAGKKTQESFGSRSGWLKAQKP
ncbi:hypothetical protein Cgig2_000967 [Carnegiea gigantea]|uniref:Uncharacterized protein n=1 Tax=Carnegiea gigantea TaxID=171969 RepID=A0A9Q1GR58_9CARY|nr:hypothetical protein Cgig2_000967 [Carnegiea gigantea]